MLLVPRARPFMEGPRSVGIPCDGLLLEDVREEMMVAIPLAPVVESDDEQVPSLEVLQQRLRSRLTHDRVAQRAAHAIENRGSQQEAPDVWRLGLQHLFDQVIGDVAVVAGEAIDESTNVVAPLDCKRGQ